MKKEKISDAIGNIGSRYIEEAMNFKKEETGNPNKNVMKKWVTIAACFVLIVGGALGAPTLIKRFAERELPVPIDDILWIEDTQDNTAAGMVHLNGWNIESYLNDVMARADDTEYIAMIVRKYIPYGDNSFVYKDATFWELRDKQDELMSQLTRFFEFEKMGEWLKYGEVLYTTGTPDGELWSKEHYDEVVAYFGEEFIAKHIINGQLNYDSLKEDRLLCETRIDELSDEISELYEAYHKSYVDDVKELFRGAGVCTIIRNDTVFIFIQKNELENLNIEGRENLVLEPASRPSFDINTNS